MIAPHVCFACPPRQEREPLESASGAAHHIGMSVTDPDDEYEALIYAAERLALRFPSVSQDEILQLVAVELAGFERTKIRKYVAVLVEGGVLRRLRRIEHERSAQHPVGS